MARMKKPKQQRPHFLRKWREHLELTQERAMDRLGWSQSKISRIESFRLPLTTDDLAAAAEAYGRTEFEILNVDPTKEGEVVDIMNRLPSASKDAREEIARFAAFVFSRSK